MFSAINIFDAIICGAAMLAAITGFKAGLVRSLAVVLGYLCAAPLAVTTASHLSPPSADNATIPGGQNSILFFAIFVAAGAIIGALLRFTINDLFGVSVNPADRIAGSCLGIIRVCFVAVTVVVVFDRIIPSDRQPAFLQSSNLQPMLLRAGQQGFKSLPPEIAGYIDQLKKDRKI